MRDRPIYVGLVCWFLILSCTWTLAHGFMKLNSKPVQKEMQSVPLPLPVQVTQYFASMVVPLVTAIFMTEGANWARVVYLAWGIASYLLSAIVVPDKSHLLPGLPIFAVCAALLLLPAARGYFLLPRHHS